MANATKVSFGNTVSLKEAAQLIVASPNVRYFLRGEPGIGKSSLLAEIGRLTGMHTTYIDCPRLDLGDIAMPFIDREQGVSNYYPNAAFGLHHGAPVVICLDEFTKAARPVQNMLHPLLEKTRPRLGDRDVTKGTIVFATGNLGSDGVGDAVAAHTLNRVVTLHVRKPTHREWLDWAIPSGRIEPVLLALCDKHPELFASYLDGDAVVSSEGKGGNPYVFSPRSVQTAFVTPRSLETASDIIKGREGNSVTTDSLIAALSGAVGEPAARLIMNFVEYADQLPSDEDIFRDPKNTPLPKLPGAYMVLVNRLTQRADKSNFAAIMEYMARAAMEWQTVFVTTISQMPSKQAMAFSDKAFGAWMAKNQALL